MISFPEMVGSPLCSSQFGFFWHALTEMHLTFYVSDVMFVLPVINRALKNEELKVKSNPKFLMKMNFCFRHLKGYFDTVLHPASGWADSKEEKRKRKSQKMAGSSQSSPDCINIRASAKKQDKLRRNPAP